MLISLKRRSYTAHEAQSATTDFLVMMGANDHLQTMFKHLCDVTLLTTLLVCIFIMMLALISATWSKLRARRAKAQQAASCGTSSSGWWWVVAPPGGSYATALYNDIVMINLHKILSSIDFCHQCCLALLVFPSLELKTPALSQPMSYFIQ